jgi:ParB family chromosome partitioning protein
MAKQKRSGLGRGLDALYEDNSAAFALDSDAGNGTLNVRLSSIEPNRSQPRKAFDEASLSELADSIREHGILQPLLVRKLPGGASLDGDAYQLVAGERRWRAARMAGLSEVPVVVREMTEAEVMEFGLIENLQREDLNPLEEAGGYQELIETFGLTQEAVARKVGRSRSAVANALRILRLPESVRPYLVSGALSMGHAKALMGIEDSEELCRLAKLAAEKGLSVREVERLAARLKADQAETAKTKKGKNVDHYYREMQIAMNQELGRKVKINMRGSEDQGVLEIAFYSKEDLQAIAGLLSGLNSHEE